MRILLFLFCLGVFSNSFSQQTVIDWEVVLRKVISNELANCDTVIALTYSPHSGIEWEMSIIYCEDSEWKYRYISYKKGYKDMVKFQMTISEERELPLESFDLELTRRYLTQIMIDIPRFLSVGVKKDFNDTLTHMPSISGQSFSILININSIVHQGTVHYDIKSKDFTQEFPTTAMVFDEILSLKRDFSIGF